MLKPQYNFTSSTAELSPSAFYTCSVAMQDLYCDWFKCPPWGSKYDIVIILLNVLPHGKYDNMEYYNSCLLPRKQGSVVNIYIIINLLNRFTIEPVYRTEKKTTQVDWTYEFCVVYYFIVLQ